MSNSLAIATVTAALKQVLKGALDRALDHLPGGNDLEVTMVRPNPGGQGMPKKGVNVFLYQATPNPSWRNSDLPARRGDGSLAQRPAAALDLHYLLSYHGEEAKWEPQRVLGIVEQTLHSRPTLSRETIRATIAAIGANPGFDFLLKSDLAEAPELVRFSPMTLSLEEMSKVWSVFLQTSYQLSSIWQASVVLIEADETPVPVRAVRERFIKVEPLARPTVDEVTNAADADLPITFPGRIAITGTDLRGDLTRVLIDSVDLAPAEVLPNRILVDLTAALRAGVHGAQVTQIEQLGNPPTPHRGPESNVAPFVLHPRITGVVTKAAVTTPGGLVSADLTVPLAPNVWRGQRSVLQLNTLPGATPARAYSFPAENRQPPPDSDASVLFKVAGVAPGTYNVHVMVDGALDAPLDADNRVILP